MDLIITHPGAAHADDLLACSLALALADENGENLPAIERREPTPEELEDPCVLILDVGGRHDPETSCYDHHQDRTLPCALHLYAEAMGLAPLFARLPWWGTVSALDTAGPFAYAKQRGMDPAILSELRGPIEGWLLRELAEYKRVESGGWLHGIMRILGAGLLREARELENDLADLRQVTSIHFAGDLRILVIEAVVRPLISSLLEGEFGGDFAVVVSHDDRGGGWTLFRIADHPRVDFSVLAEDSAILFAHKVGFVAKTRERLPLEAALALVERAIVPAKGS